MDAGKAGILAAALLVAACAGPGDVDLGDAVDELSPDELTLVETINAERAARGRSPVTLRSDLNCAAQVHSDDIGDTRTCSHDGSDGSSPSSRVSGCGGAGWSGEIIACGQPTPRAAVDAWLSSDGHREIMLNSTQKTVGVAVHNNFWTAIFDQR